MKGEGSNAWLLADDILIQAENEKKVQEELTHGMKELSHGAQDTV